jgi:hypothetical protein
VKRKSFGRRELMRAAGLTLLVPPFLRDAFAGGETPEPALVLFMQPCGTHQAAFWPDPVSGTSPILEPLLSDPALAAKTLLVKGVSNMTGGVLGNEHDRGFMGLFTGVVPIGSPVDPFAGGPSIDQTLKRLLAPGVLYPTLNCGVLAADVGPKNGHRRSFSYLGPGQQVPTLTDPYRLYAELFPRTDVGSATERLARKRSVLDYAASDLVALSGRLGPNERRKLDAHATALREYEARLSASLGSVDATCARPGEPAAGIDVNAEANVPWLVDMMLELVANALACNLTRVVTFQLGLCGAQWRYDWLGIGKDGHEQVAHYDDPAGTNVEATAAMIQISRWVADRVAGFARRLEALPAPESSVLDRSLVLWANENGNGIHGMDDIPLVFLGRAAGRLTRTGLVDQGRQTHYQLGTTLLRLMGVEAAGFGDDPVSGPLLGVY